MTHLTRRAALGVAAVTIGTIGLKTGAALAAAPAAGKQAASWYRHKLGDIELTVVSDGVAVGDRVVVEGQQRLQDGMRVAERASDNGAKSAGTTGGESS